MKGKARLERKAGRQTGGQTEKQMRGENDRLD
jgi:hypothetical protein